MWHQLASHSEGSQPRGIFLSFPCPKQGPPQSGCPSALETWSLLISSCPLHSSHTNVNCFHPCREVSCLQYLHLLFPLPQSSYSRYLHGFLLISFAQISHFLRKPDILFKMTVPPPASSSASRLSLSLSFSLLLYLFVSCLAPLDCKLLDGRDFFLSHILLYP